MTRGPGICIAGTNPNLDNCLCQPTGSSIIAIIVAGVNKFIKIKYQISEKTSRLRLKMILCKEIHNILMVLQAPGLLVCAQIVNILGTCTRDTFLQP